MDPLQGRGMTQLQGEHFINFERRNHNPSTICMSRLQGTRITNLHMFHLNKLIKHELVVGLLKIKFVKDKLYNTCRKDKQTKVSFKPKHIVSTLDHYICYIYIY
ncbi:hypothetical protein Lal_00042135 [Lupinus albus]|nr:hypothetical protein Lal_00042135 [Lupinus albus]